MSPSFREYQPLQPGLEYVTTEYLSLDPYQSNEHLPAMLFYQFKTVHPFHEYIPILPDACIEIMIHLNPNKPTAKICGSVLNHKKIRFPSDFIHFGVRLLPEHGIRLIHYPMDEVIDNEISLACLTDEHDKLIDSLLSTATFQDRVTLFRSFFQNQQLNVKSIPDYIKYAIRQVYLTKGNVKINQLAKRIGFSEQYFRKQFKKYVGLSPKLFSRIIRFQKTLQAINENKDLLDIVETYGFYDQPHLIREYRSFNYFSPLEVRDKLRTTQSFKDDSSNII